MEKSTDCWQKVLKQTRLAWYRVSFIERLVAKVCLWRWVTAEAWQSQQVASVSSVHTFVEQNSFGSPVNVTWRVNWIQWANKYTHPSEVAPREQHSRRVTACQPKS